ncbi:hypothetical protein C8F04DRAFT_1258550 [Mycena alexandri]|uniref:Aminoglycoside phosphotransferase domain-containing protein n=1 Tax=Mycena alexandri TaxID=1745969 RepID=A0AAD6X424_9AGAR|nr:hypothetical protein C8F04DRAFT_1258550 [Mycena alexandri]
MSIQLDDMRAAFVRVLVRRDEDPSTEMWRRARLFAELSILRWLQLNAPELPVPRVLAFDGLNDMLITTLMPGLDAAHAYTGLDALVKERSITSWARVSVLMFRLPAPQRRFGTIEDTLVHANFYLSTSPEHIFEINENASLLSFFESAISSRRARSAKINNAREQEILSQRLDRLLEGLRPLVPPVEETTYMSRLNLTHCDLRRPNKILLDETSGEVLDSPFYRRFAVSKSKMVSFYLEPRAERNRLCDLYEQTVKHLDEEYYICLIQGTRLRDALAWIENSARDSDGYGMERWTEEHLFQTDADHRCA